MKLHGYQRRAVDFMDVHHRCVLSVGMGLGKTAAVLHWLERLKPKSALIVAPKRVAESVWLQEAEKWELDVAKRMVVVTGTAQQRYAVMCDDKRPYKVIGRDNLKDLFDKRGFLLPCYKFEAVVFDELTSFKSVEASRTAYAVSLAYQAKRCVGLTGTFLANGAIDVYAQMASVGLTRDGLKGFWSWRACNFRDAMAGSGRQWHKWKLARPLEEVLRPWRQNIFTLDAKDYLDIPDVTVIPHEVELTKEERQRYDELQAFLGCDIGGVEVSVDEGAKFAKLQTMCDGFMYVGERDALDKPWTSDNVVRGDRSTKLEEVAELCRRCVAEGENVLVFYAFKAEREWLRELMARDGFEVAEVRESGVLERWMSGDFNGVMMAHPASAGHGLNLQGGGRVMVWSTLTYNYEHYAQANARLARQGQRRAVHIHVFTAKGTLEDEKAKSLAAKERMQQAFLKLTKELGLVED